jgi:hypothetical protein
MTKTVEEKVDDAVHAAITALGLSVATCPDLADSLNDWLSEQVPEYITDEDED